MTDLTLGLNGGAKVDKGLKSRSEKEDVVFVFGFPKGSHPMKMELNARPPIPCAQLFMKCLRVFDSASRTSFSRISRSKLFPTSKDFYFSNLYQDQAFVKNSSRFIMALATMVKALNSGVGFFSKGRSSSDAPSFLENSTNEFSYSCFKFFKEFFPISVNVALL